MLEQDLLPLVRVRRARLSTASIPRSGQILSQHPGFVAGTGSTQHTGRKPTVYRYALLVLFNKISVTVGFHQLRNTGECFFPANALPFVRTRRTIFRVAQTVFAVDVIQQTGPFRAQRTTAYRMIRVTFNVINRFSGVFAPSPGYTSIARNLRNSMCRCYGSLSRVIICSFAPEPVLASGQSPMLLLLFPPYRPRRF